MKKWHIPVVYQMTGSVEVEAENIDEAIDKAMEEPIPLDSSYVEDSFDIDYDGIENNEDEE